MSPETHDLTWSELDRLADYTADALSAADAAFVARLVATDPRWSAAHRALRQAEVAVRADLATAAAQHSPMPDDVAEQIDAALRRLTPTVISLDAARHKRRRAFTAGIAAAAATVVAVIGGIALNTSLVQTQTGSPAMEADGSAGRDAPNVPGPAPSALAGADAGPAARARVLASGIDYRLDTLPQLAAQAPPPGPSNEFKTEQSPQFAAGEAPDGLARLATPAGLADCLRAVNRSYPGVAVVLDYARFDGLPALVIVIQQTGSSKVIAVGANCGVADTDEQAAVSAG
jgi:hypothetical protein